MTRTIEVEVDETGRIHPLQPVRELPKGRALLTWPVDEGAIGLIMSERSLADWLRPEENEAWAHLQPDRLPADSATLPETPQAKARPIWEVILENMEGVSPDEFAKLPKDGASEHDHYLYGHPKRNQ